MLHPREVRGAGPTYPKRLFITLMGTHVRPTDWCVPDGPLGDLSAYPCLAPLNRHAKNLMIVKGLDIRPKDFDASNNDAPGIGHNTVVQLFTGRNAGPGGHDATGESIDRFIARQTMTQTPFLAIDTRAELCASDDIPWTGRSQPVAAEADAQALFQRVFGNGAGPSLSNLERKSVLDYSVADLKRYIGTLGSGDRATVEAHLNNVQQIEKEIAGLSAACQAPTIPPDLVYTPGGPYGTDQTPQYPLIPGFIKAFCDIILAAMACDATRLGTFNFSGFADDKRADFLIPILGQEYATPPGQNVDAWIHGVFDHADDPRLSPYIGWYANASLGYMMDKLSAIPEGAGTMLDNTALILLQSMGGVTHGAKNIQCIIGGGGSFLKTGYSYHAAPDPLPEDAGSIGWSSQAAGQQDKYRTINDLWCALATAFGAKLDDGKTFGAPNYCWQPLSEILV
jgi:hypothetical protein